MAVLASQFRYVATFGPQSRDVYEQPCVCIKITSVYSVVIIRRWWIDIMWVYLQQVVSPFVLMQSHVIVTGKEMYRGSGNLSIDIRVPRQDLKQFRNEREKRALSRRTLRFHHQPISVPCIIQVSTPISLIVERYDSMSKLRFVRCAS